MRARLRARAAAALGVALLLLTGCGSATEAPVPPSPRSSAITVVTVPGLGSARPGPAETSRAEGGVISVVPRTSESPAQGQAPTGTSTTPAGGAQPGTGADATMPAPQTVSSRAAVAPHDPTAPPTTEPTTVAVDLASCAGCNVIGAAAQVQPGLAASLATAPQGAVLLATRADGTVAGVANVPYGVAFPAPSDGVLPCDRSGRCFVTAAQSGGDGVISVFHLAADGQWSDVTASGGFGSVTSTALVRDVDGDGLLDIAVQARSDGALRWVVYHWAADRFVVLGCVAGSQPLPAGSDVSLAACS